MPALSPTMTSGNIGTWQKNIGDAIAPGDSLVEIETDKAQMDFEYQEDGILAKILKPSGSKDIAVGNPIAVIVEEEADVSAFEDYTVESTGGEAKKESPDSSEPPKPSPEPVKSEEPTSSGGRLETVLERDGRIIATPVAKNIALEKGIALKDVRGTGEGGRITKADVESYKSDRAFSAPGAAISTDIPLTSMRKTIASRLQASKNTNPHYYVSASLSVSKLLKLRQALNASAKGEYKLSVNDFLIKAVANALLKVPTANSSYREDEGVIRQFSTADISVAVATPVGLMTPIVKNADARGLVSISNEVKSLSGRARDGKLKPEEYQGGTFTISNMGMNPAVERFTAIINPPQAGILAVGTIKKVAVEGKDGGVEWDEQIVVTGSFDHRVVDGAVGGEFLRELKKLIENPLEMLL
ncbi:2-oxoacid dehydrogenases acyltransferase-domain-containing protein [Tuber borchii]|uniref:Acetyltransferase component of pyruvate dehydrogenase complex n=1 Tax=Tuber borchii TaxID=42251 RepID=A0A2T6ZXM0_TUBBO|nr:2-oxoacid dehydrogenases acyltransferase-domain-containing protein [Tuber borchii]